MKTFLLAPDSFKGTLRADEVCALQSQVIRRYMPDAVIHAIPMSDGGEGMVESYLRVLGGQRRSVFVTGPLGEPVEAVYGILPNGSAVTEMAAAAGLPLVEGRLDPLHASTVGVGELLRHLASEGVTDVLLGLGGSATNDCGVGMAAALGWRFLDGGGQPLAPVAAELGRIETILPPEHPLELHVQAACDVNNPLTGPDGATLTFGPQKGAGPVELAQLEAGMVHFAAVLEQHFRLDTMQPGTGAAGGLGAAVLAFLGGSLLPGAELLLQSAGFDTLLKDADLVITGEGRIDWQSAHGKVPGTIARHCKAAGVPCVALCGSIGKNAETLYNEGITAIFSAVQGAASFDEIRKTAREDMEFLTDSVLRLLL